VCFRIRNAEGNYRWFLSRAEPLRANDGTVLSWIGINLDSDERKQAEFYLAEGQRLAHTGSWAFNAAGFEHWSPELFAIHGLDPHSKPPSVQEYLELVHPDDRAFVSQTIQTMLSEHRNVDFTKRIVRPDGLIRHVRFVGVPATTAGIFERFVGTGVDVTESEELTQALRTSEQQFRLVIDNIAGLVATLTPRGDIDFVNRQVHQYFGKTLDELKNWQMNDAVHLDDRDRVVAIWANTIATGQPSEAEYRLRRSDGVYRWFQGRWRLLRDAEGSIARWYVLLLDIHDRKQAEDKIRDQETELRQMLDLAPQIIGVLGPQRERLYANRAALAYYGVTLEEWRQRTFGPEVHPDDFDRVKAVVDRSVANPAAYEAEMRLRRGDGTYRWFLVRYNPLHDDQGRLVRWYLACTDIDERRRAEERLHQENVALREEVDKASMFEEIVGGSPALTAVLARVSKVASSDSTVLITGETGTGKELVARAIHRRSRRSPRAFIAVNCAAIPRDLIASELFGHEKGAFTGAVQRRLGRFELADGGTIFLDEVGELASETQVALLRVLQEREFERVGGGDRIRVDVRVIAATNRDLSAEVAEGTFRQDLFYRLNVFPLDVPPLRERREDVPLLVEYFIGRYSRKAGKRFKRVSKRTLDRLKAYPWPGNIRELQNVIERSVILSDTDEFTVDESWLAGGTVTDSRLGLSGRLSAHEKEIVEEALRASGGRVAGPAGAAARLGLPRSTLESKIRLLKINKSRFRSRTPRSS
jgi:formate hydrogenlyase transcriptional activator